MGVHDLDDIILIPILQGLWESLARPVFTEIKPQANKEPMRIWWCPTGPLAFLPIHAAGPYEGDAPGLPELVVSSYIPTLHSLLRAHSTAEQPFSMLAIGQPATPGQAPLPAVHKELAVLERASARLNKDPPTTLLGPTATAHSVSRALPSHTWLHFSCHAHQDPSYAFASAFFMHDGPLRLGALMQLDLARVQFAFLSACLTSAGDERLPDESIHLAAGLQFAGVRSAIATLWSVDDRAAAWIVERVYDHLMREGVEEPDPLEAAEALHRAVCGMKAKGRPMGFWVPFVHTGI
ncbi:CHAT domain-containing protein [Trametes gibbosa]|nr:CHAT domain-containing protein [Trametes gibbosa]